MGYREAITEAHKRLLPYIHCTPILSSTYFDSLTKSKLFFKCENFQKTGSFKIRGATNTLLLLDPRQRQYGVCTHSSGNHGQAVASSAKNLQTKAYIVMPEDSPKVKYNAVLNYGAEIILCKRAMVEREKKIQKIIEKTNAYFISPFNDENIIAGQGTVALELFNQLEINPLDYLLVPVGGGGLLSGIALSVYFYSPSTKIIGCEPEQVNDAWLSLKIGSLQASTEKNTIADGLRAPLGDKTFSIIKKYVHQILTVKEETIIEAMKLVWERMKIIIEPSAAVPFAAVLRYKNIFEGKKIGIIFSGGNIDLDTFFFQVKNENKEN